MRKTFSTLVSSLIAVILIVSVGCQTDPLPNRDNVLLKKLTKEEYLDSLFRNNIGLVTLWMIDTTVVKGSMGWGVRDTDMFDSNANVVFNSPAPGVEALGNKDVEIQKFKISPNPNVTSEICIESVEIIESIEILDGAGKSVMSLFPNKKQLDLDIDRLKPATYSIVCKSKNEIITRKFIKLNY